MIWSKIFGFHKPNTVHKLRLAILWVLRGLPDDFGIHLGLKCASFSKMNVGTSSRAPCASLGFESFCSVLMGNQLLERMGLAIQHALMLLPALISALVLIKCMVIKHSDPVLFIYFGHSFYIFKILINDTANSPRSCLLISLATCLGAVWSLEQPSGSLAEFYPAFRETMQNIFTCGGPHAAGVPNTFTWV